MSRLALIGIRTLLSSSREGDAALADALRRFHDGADRGELRALLCEAWGPSPASVLERARAKTLADRGDYQLADAIRAQDEDAAAILGRLEAKVAGIIERGASDLRGLAARESQRQREPEHTGFAATWCPICDDCTCPYLHGIEGNGRTFDEPTCPMHGASTKHPALGDESAPLPTATICVCDECAAVLPCPCDCHGPPT